MTSTCPVTGQEITLTVAPNGLTDIQPHEAALSFLRPTPEMKKNVIESFCHYVLLFASSEAADQWTAEHPGTFVIGLHDAFELGRRTLGRLGGKRASA